MNNTKYFFTIMNGKGQEVEIGTFNSIDQAKIAKRKVKNLYLDLLENIKFTKQVPDWEPTNRDIFAVNSN